MIDNKKDDKKPNNDNKEPFGNYKGPAKSNPPSMMRNLMIWSMIILSILIFYSLLENMNNKETYVSYTQYQYLLTNGLIKYAEIEKSKTNDFVFHGTLKHPVSLKVATGKTSVIKMVTKLGFVDTATESKWKENHLSWKYKDAGNTIGDYIISFLPWLLIIGIFVFFMSRMQGGGQGGKNVFSFGKSKAKLTNPNNQKITFADVAGADEAKYELEEIIQFLKEPDRFRRLGGKIPHGVLLLGSPGTGKTLLARAVAGEAGVPFYSISGADFVEMFVGVGASRVRDLFEQAKQTTPCIVFIDEIDAVGRHRGAGLGGGHDEREQTLNQLLVEMDGFEQNLGVIVIAATNRPDVLDPALLRPGRFDRRVMVDLPDALGRFGIFKVHTKKIPLSDDVDLERISRGTPGLSGAEIANITNEAALLAARRDSEKVTMMDFEQARDKVLMGVERKSMVISPREKELTAYHEMGHALSSKLLPNADPLHKVTIIPRGRALGLTWNFPNEEFHSKSKEYFEDTLVVLMAGRAAEKLMFDKETTGASNDLDRASQIARKMVCDWGMSKHIGPVTFRHQQEDVFLGRDISQPKDHSEKTQEEIDDEVRTILLTAMKHAENLLTVNKDLLTRGAKVLLEREILDAEELDVIIRGEELPPISSQKLTALRNINFNIKDDDINSDRTIAENTI
ncbi:MAG: ATP-dependent zinc metalloprotease FtsH [bacterium]